MHIDTQTRREGERERDRGKTQTDRRADRYTCT